MAGQLMHVANKIIEELIPLATTNIVDTTKTTMQGLKSP